MAKLPFSLELTAENYPRSDAELELARLAQIEEDAQAAQRQRRDELSARVRPVSDLLWDAAKQLSRDFIDHDALLAQPVGLFNKKKKAAERARRLQKIQGRVGGISAYGYFEGGTDVVEIFVGSILYPVSSTVVRHNDNNVVMYGANGELRVAGTDEKLHAVDALTDTQTTELQEYCQSVASNTKWQAAAFAFEDLDFIAHRKHILRRGECEDKQKQLDHDLWHQAEDEYKESRRQALMGALAVVNP